MFQHITCNSSLFHKGCFSIACSNFLKVFLPIFPPSPKPLARIARTTHKIGTLKFKEYIKMCMFSHLNSLPLLSDQQLWKWEKQGLPWGTAQADGSLSHQAASPAALPLRASSKPLLRSLMSSFQISAPRERQIGAQEHDLDAADVWRFPTAAILPPSAAAPQVGQVQEAVGDMDSAGCT